MLSLAGGILELLSARVESRRIPVNWRLLDFAVLALASLLSCAPVPMPTPVPAPSPAPPHATSLPAPQLDRVEGFTDHIELTWRTFRNDRDLIKGYNIYVANFPGLAGLTDENPELKRFLYDNSTYPGDTDGIIDSESISIQPVMMGTRYFVHVRTAFPDGHQGPPSEEREVIARPRGSMTLGPRFSGAKEGFSFASDREVPSLSDSNDVYLFIGRDGPHLGSPARLDASLRRTAFSNMGPSASIEDYPACFNPPDRTDKIAVLSGQTTLVTLNDGRMAKLRPRNLTGGRDSLRVTFDYIYQPIIGEPHF